MGYSPSSSIRRRGCSSNGLLGAAPELEVRLLERALHRIRRQLLQEEPGQHDLGDP